MSKSHDIYALFSCCQRHQNGGHMNYGDRSFTISGREPT
jgi:hypothetical protein